MPEEQWGPRSWGRNHPLYVRGQIEHGLDDAKYGYWGFSPSSDPAGGYREYGVDAMGLDTGRLHLRRGAHQRRLRLRRLPDRPAQPAPAAYGDGVVTPHASFLAMRYAPDGRAWPTWPSCAANFDSLRARRLLRRGGGRAAARWRKRYLALDQGMIMAALGNLYGGDVLREEFSRGGAERLLRPVMRIEEFSVPERQ